MDHSGYVFRMCKGLLALNMEFTVLTNSLRVLNELSKSAKIHLIAVGGRYDENEQAFLGPTASNYLQQFQVDRAFFLANLLITREVFLSLTNELPICCEQ